MNDPGPPRRVLLVDDAPGVREALRWALEDEPDLVVVGEAGDGDEALRRAADLAPDVIILDVALPGQDGFAVARALKTAARPPAVVFLTVHADADARRRGAAAGGDGFVAKGTGWAALLAEVRRVVIAPPRVDGRGHPAPGAR
ncbi:MAG TPA: response regulator transcription factor [Thermomicrobiales bacterium]|nr:response regulator transcription factor [Thermomicrobiales bacterium]